MNLFIGFTTDAWIERHRSRYEGGLTDWWMRPGSTRFRNAVGGDLFFFKPGSAKNLIGWARVVERITGPATSIWDRLPRDYFAGQTWKSRAQSTLKGSSEANGRDPNVSSLVLADCVFLPEGQALPLPEDFKPVGTQGGRKYENAETDSRVEYLIQATDARSLRSDVNPEPTSGRPRRKAAASLLTEAYSRSWPESIREISRLQNLLALRFSAWLKEQGYTDVRYERDYVDISFRCGRQSVMAELKVCSSFSPRRAIREAVGQVLEYNLYWNESCADEWWIVLDQHAAAADLKYIKRLRAEFSFPLFLAYEDEDSGFCVVRS